MKKSDMLDLTYSDIEKVMNEKGYQFFKGDMNVNIIGVRMGDKFSNSWSDVLFVAYENRGEKILDVYKDFSTLAGNYYVKEKLLNKKGVAILPEGQHKGLWAIGKHRGKYKALVQKKIVTVLRDNNKDEIVDPKSSTRGQFGINLHHGYNSKNVDKNSAGCQVLKYQSDLKNKFMRVIEESAHRFGNSFTYTLLSKNEF